MEWKMERNGIKTYTVAAIQCNWRCSIYVELLVVSLGLLSHCRNFMSKFGTACRHASISKHGTVASHHQVLCYCGLAKPDSHTENNSLASGDYCYRIDFMVKNVMAGISA